MIGKSKNLWAFKNVENLPVIYINQPRAWMTASYFVYRLIRQGFYFRRKKYQDYWKRKQ